MVYSEYCRPVQNGRLALGLVAALRWRDGLEFEPNFVRDGTVLL